MHVLQLTSNSFLRGVYVDHMCNRRKIFSSDKLKFSKEGACPKLSHLLASEAFSLWILLAGDNEATVSACTVSCVWK